MITPTLVELQAAYRGKRVFVTGHTGFKGGWLTLWLEELGAQVTGFALPPDTDPAFFHAVDVAKSCRHREGDVRDPRALAEALEEARPDFVFHLAAQPLVRKSYERPIETIETNVLGTAHLLEALRTKPRRCAVVVVTSDKCYENREWIYGYREDEPMGGHDVYSMSKGAAELVVASYRRSFFPPARLAEHGVALATARAGNVVGGGDFASDRIVPDAVRALSLKQPIRVRNPRAIRPWQHVLDPLGGYLLLGARLAGVGAERPGELCEGWNFGPSAEGVHPVREVVEALIRAWGDGTWESAEDPKAPHEAGWLRLSIDKAAARLGWAPRWGFAKAMERTAHWYRAHHDGANAAELRELARRQIRDFLSCQVGG